MATERLDTGVNSNMGINFRCPFCGYTGPLDLMGADRYPVLSRLQVIGAGRRKARCAKCASTDKERLVYTYLKDVVGLHKQDNINVLHIAPESNLQTWLKSVSSYYIAGDAFLQNQNFIGDVRYVDICRTDFDDNIFDYIICNHVICDIKDAKSALSEIYRILKPGGVAILQVPITKVSKTVEFENVHTKEDREIAYGYGYHERIYNDNDYVELLSSVKFQVEVLNITKDYCENGLNPLEDLYICKK